MLTSCFQHLRTLCDQFESNKVKMRHFVAAAFAVAIAHRGGARCSGERLAPGRQTLGLLADLAVAVDLGDHGAVVQRSPFGKDRHAAQRQAVSAAQTRATQPDIRLAPASLGLAMAATRGGRTPLLGQGGYVPRERRGAPGRHLSPPENRQRHPLGVEERHGAGGRRQSRSAPPRGEIGAYRAAQSPARQKSPPKRRKEAGARAAICREIVHLPRLTSTTLIGPLLSMSARHRGNK